MNKQDKETLRLTLMAFENNSTNVRNIRVMNSNNLSLDEIQAILNIEHKMDDVKNAIMSVIHNQFPKKNHLMQISEFEENSFIRPDNPFLNDNFD